MKRPFDIRDYKKALRNRYKAVRKNMKPAAKAGKDKAILRHVRSLPEYRRASTILCYVSTPWEVDTYALIRRAWEDGKKVAVPYCLPDSRKMDFYLIDSFDCLEPRTFGVLEPVPQRCTLLTGYQDTLCILPGLAFDRWGYRLGYGGGYYDRFLSKKYNGFTVGICYQACTQHHLVHGRFDMPCDVLVTEHGPRRTKNARIKKERAPK